MSKNYLQKISDTHWLVANDLEGKNIQLYYVNLLYFDKNIVLGFITLMLAVSYIFEFSAHTLRILNYHLLYLSSVYDLYVIVAFRKFLECVCISLDTFLAYYVSILYKYVSDIKVGL